MDAKQIQQLILSRLPDAQVDVTGGEGKFEATVVDAAFAGLTPVQRHRKVYDSVRAHIEDGSLHALSIRPRAPDEAP